MEVRLWALNRERFSSMSAGLLATQASRCCLLGDQEVAPASGLRRLWRFVLSPALPCAKTSRRLSPTSALSLVCRAVLVQQVFLLANC